MVTIAPVHDHTRHQECEYTNQTHVIVQFSILNCSVSYYRHSCFEHCFQMCPLSRISWKIANYTEIGTLGPTFWDLGILGNLRDQVAALALVRSAKNYRQVPMFNYSSQERIRINVKFLLQNSREQKFRRDYRNSAVNGCMALADVFVTWDHNQMVLKLLRQRSNILQTGIYRSGLKNRFF